MAIQRLDPLDEQVFIWDADDPLYADSLARMLGNWPELEQSDETIQVALKEKEDQILIRIEIPGLIPGDLEVHTTGSFLKITGSRYMQFKPEEGHPPENPCRRFHRYIALPVCADTSQIHAYIQNESVHLAVPKKDDLV